MSRPRPKNPFNCSLYNNQKSCGNDHRCQWNLNESDGSQTPRCENRTDTLAARRRSTLPAQVSPVRSASSVQARPQPPRLTVKTIPHSQPHSPSPRVQHRNPSIQQQPVPSSNVLPYRDSLGKRILDRISEKAQDVGIGLQRGIVEARDDALSRVLEPWREHQRAKEARVQSNREWANKRRAARGLPSRQFRPRPPLPPGRVNTPFDLATCATTCLQRHFAPIDEQIKKLNGHEMPERLKQAIDAKINEQHRVMSELNSFQYYDDDDTEPVQADEPEDALDTTSELDDTDSRNGGGRFRKRRRKITKRKKPKKLKKSKRSIKTTRSKRKTRKVRNSTQRVTLYKIADCRLKRK